MTQRHVLMGVIAVTLIGFFLRIYDLDRFSFRGDEAFTVINWMQQPLHVTLSSDIPVRDPQPPLAYALFWIWGQAVGFSETAVRMLPVLAGALGIPGMYALGRRIGGRSVGLLSASLWAVHPYLIWHSQDARNYALWSTGSLLAVWLALRALACRRRLDWLLYVVAAAVAAYLYYLELFVLLVLNIYVFVVFWRCWLLLRQWIFAQVVVGVLLAPWYLQERLLVSSGYGGTTYSASVVNLFDWFLPSLVFGEVFPWGSVVWPLLVVFFLIAFVALWRLNWRNVLLIVILVFLPPVLLLIVAFRLDVFTPRYVLGVVPAYLLLGSLFVLRVLKSSVLFRPVALVVLLGWFGFGGVGLVQYFFDYAKSPDWRILTAYLHQRVTDNDIVIQSAADEAFTYYYGNAAQIQRLPANPNQSALEIERILAEDSETYRSIWLVANPFPDWPNAFTGQLWLQNNMQQIRNTDIAALPVRQFMPWALLDDESGSIPLAQFGDVAQLLGVRPLLPVDPDGSLLVLAYWQPLVNTQQDLKVFAHLIASSSDTETPISQDDQFPQDGRILTSQWAGKAVFRDLYTLPVGSLPPGDYTLLVGLYDPQTGERITTTDGADRVAVADIPLP